MICYNCKGNGYVKVRFEAEQVIKQCSVCHSQGEIDEDTHYYQTWTEGENGAVAYYYGPPLDPECFKNYTISNE